MAKHAFILAGLASVALAACSGGGKAEDAAVNNLQVQSEEAVSNMAQIAAEIPDADQANMVVNEASDLMNAEDAVANAK